MPKFTIDVPEGHRVLIAPAPIPALRDVTAELVPVVAQPPAPEPVPVPVSPPVVVTPEPAPAPPPTSVEDRVWVMPISYKRIRYRPTRVERDRVFLGNAWGIALNGERPGTLSRTRYERCRFIGGRYAAFLTGQEDLEFDDCDFDSTPPAPAGLNEEAAIRIENSSRIRFIACRILNGAPKHAFRVHRFARDIVLEDCVIRSAGNGFMLGTYRGQSGAPSDVQDLEIVNVETTITAVGPDVDEFNPGVGGLRNLRIRGLSMKVTSETWTPPASNPALGWVFERFTRG